MKIRKMVAFALQSRREESVQRIEKVRAATYRFVAQKGAKVGELLDQNRWRGLLWLVEPRPPLLSGFKTKAADSSLGASHLHAGVGVPIENDDVSQLASELPAQKENENRQQFGSTKSLCLPLPVSVASSV